MAGDPHRTKLITFRYRKKQGSYVRTQGYGAKTTEEILEAWQAVKPLSGSDPFPLLSGRRRRNIIWTRAAAAKVLDMVDRGQVSRPYTHQQIAEQLNRPETAAIYKHWQDRDRVFTPGNVQALLRKIFPSTEDTQAGVNLLEQAKTWSGWEDLKTCSEVFKDDNGLLRIHRLTVTLPLARRLLAEYGDFLLIDCTFKLTIFAGRYTLVISVVDRCAHVHPVVFADVPGHREIDWLKAFNDGWDLVQQQSPNHFKPKTALLMRDREQAIDTAWEKSHWDKHVSSARCTKHSQWNVQNSKMKNGELFGSKRGNAWYSLIFSTCDQSFRDRAATLAAHWRQNGDDVGADHLINLCSSSDAPLHRWSPVACPFIAAGASESVNQLIKKTPSDGKRRLKLNFMQQCRVIVNVAYRSWQVLRDGPPNDAARLVKRTQMHLKQQGRMAPGRYAVLLAGLQQLTWPAFKIFEQMVEESFKHRAVLGKCMVYSNYKEIADPDKKYEHRITQKKDSWQCVVVQDNRPCWQFKIRGLFCSHMCAYAVQTINNGGSVDLDVVGKSSILRCRNAQLHGPIKKVAELAEPLPDTSVFSEVPSHNENPTIYEIIRSVKSYASRGGKKGLKLLLEIIQRRLLGGSPGPACHALVDEFMTTTTNPLPTKKKKKKTDKKKIYGNNAKDEGNKQRKRMRNRGDVAAYSTGRSSRRDLAVKKTAANYTLSGINRRTDKNYFSIKIATELGVLEENHSLFYLTPFTATTDAEQLDCLQEAGLFDSDLVGLDLEWAGPRYPKKNSPGIIYDASLLVLSCARGTVLYHLWQYQNPESDGMHWPGPFLPKVETAGKWVAAKTPQHGPKWALPVALVKLLQCATFAGRQIQGDITRLKRVFGMDDLFKQVRYFDIDRLKLVKEYPSKSKASGLSDYLLRETGYVLPDKGNKTLRTKGWNTSEVLTEKQKGYATLDGIASYLLGT